MKKTLSIVFSCALLLSGQFAFAHRIDEYLQATLASIEADDIRVSMRLIPGVLVAPSVISNIDIDGDGVFSDAEQRAYAERVLADLVITIDGKSAQAKLISWRFPSPAEMREGLGEIHIDYTVAFQPGGGNHRFTIDNHHQSSNSVYLMNVLAPQDNAIQVLTQKRNAQQSFYEVDYQQTSAVAAGPLDTVLAWLDGVQFSALFDLGIRHIAEGTDHLLFLLALLLPAPLTVAGRRWGPPVGARKSLLRILGIVTAFTVGHSITLALGALGIVTVPSRLIEALIAVSIFVSSVHAIRPIFPGREIFIAAGFGLVHGLAFAATLDRLGLGLWERVAGILAFNLGIETMQMLVVAAILPSLLLLCGTRAYPVLRIGGGAFACIAALGWMLERIFNLDLHVDSVVDVLALHGVAVAAALFIISLVCRLATDIKHRQSATNAESKVA